MKSISFASFFIWLQLCYGANPILHYEPKTVELVGIIEYQTLPGAPESKRESTSTHCGTPTEVIKLEWGGA